MTTGPRVTPGLVQDILDALERHGYYRGDDTHADRAIGLIGDLAGVYEGTQDYPASPFMMPPSLPACPGPSLLTRDDASTIFAAMDITGDKRSRVQMCPDWPTGPAPTARPTCTTSRPSTRWPTACSTPPRPRAGGRARARSPAPARRRQGGRPVTPAGNRPGQPATQTLRPSSPALGRESGTSQKPQTPTTCHSPTTRHPATRSS